MTIDWNSFALGAGAGIVGLIIILGLFYVAKKKKAQNQGNNRMGGRGYPQQPFQRKQKGMGMQKPFFKRRQMQQPVRQRQPQPQPRYQPQPQYIEPVAEPYYDEPYYDDQQVKEPLYDEEQYVEQPQEVQYQEPYQDEYDEDNFGGR
jgi:hypothetical protein